jgi:hypothetical protein
MKIFRQTLNDIDRGGNFLTDSLCEIPFDVCQFLNSTYCFCYTANQIFTEIFDY